VYRETKTLCKKKGGAMPLTYAELSILREKIKREDEEREMLLKHVMNVSLPQWQRDNARVRLLSSYRDSNKLLERAFAKVLEE